MKGYFEHSESYFGNYSFVSTFEVPFFVSISELIFFVCGIFQNISGQETAHINPTVSQKF